jgi:hypothetical protein
MASHEVGKVDRRRRRRLSTRATSPISDRPPGQKANMGTGKPKEDDRVWLVRVSIPRRLVVQMATSQHDFYDDDVDIDQVEDAKDDGLDSESSYHTDEQAVPGTDPMAAQPGGAAPPGGPPGGAAPAPAPGGPR